MAWIKQTSKPWYHRLIRRILCSGETPKHVAFIMDGNRRFAKKNSLEKLQGHSFGFEKLAQTLEWCLDLNITEVTVYAFSIENFKRSPEEVDYLMQLAREKFSHLLKEKDLIDTHHVCVRVIGNLSLLPRDIQRLLAEAVEHSRHNTRAVLNVCFAYTSRDEICTAMQSVSEGIKENIINENDINQNLLSQSLYTNLSSNPDLLIRTSGEVRLSDFLLWQTSHSVIAFVNVLWPEFNVWHFYAAIVHYQRNISTIKELRESSAHEEQERNRSSDYACVLSQLSTLRTNGLGLEGINLSERLNQYKISREERSRRFIETVKEKQHKYFTDLLTEPT